MQANFSFDHQTLGSQKRKNFFTCLNLQHPVCYHLLLSRIVLMLFKQNTFGYQNHQKNLTVIYLFCSILDILALDRPLEFLARRSSQLLRKGGCKVARERQRGRFMGFLWNQLYYTTAPPYPLKVLFCECEGDASNDSTSALQDLELFFLWK